MKGFVNWNELWKMTRLEPKKGLPEFADMNRAKWFDEAIKGHNKRTEKQLASIQLDPEYTVLDVGAGTGRLAIPIAKNVKKVTAIEPSEAMLACLEKNTKKEGINNIHCINKRWEDIEIGVDIEPHDVVIASHSLAMLDIQGALIKIDSAAKKSAYLFTFVNNLRGIIWMDDARWNKIYGKKDQIWSDYIYLSMILHEMDIYANVNVWNSEFSQKYDNKDAVIAHWREVYETPPENEIILKEWLSRMLIEKEGSVYLRGKSKSAVVSWRKENENAEMELAKMNTAGMVGIR
jgi:SAM-dependent methyltransferase